jgi:hypothetical protein
MKTMIIIIINIIILFTINPNNLARILTKQVSFISICLTLKYIEIYNNTLDSTNENCLQFCTSTIEDNSRNWIYDTWYS